MAIKFQLTIRVKVLMLVDTYVLELVILLLATISCKELCVYFMTSEAIGAARSQSWLSRRRKQSVAVSQAVRSWWLRLGLTQVWNVTERIQS